jgi:hypothetical protein
VALFLVSCSNNFALALFADDVGLSDFLVATTGHGAVKFVHYAAKNMLVTSDSPVAGHQLLAEAPDTSCYVAGRDLENGQVTWRRNVCASKNQMSHHVVAAAQETWWSMDSLGVVRGWSMDKGNLLWDALVPQPTNQPRLLVPPSAKPTIVGAVAEEIMVVLDATTGEALGTPLLASQVLRDNGCSSRGEARWLQLVSQDEDKWSALIGWAHQRDGVVSSNGSDLLMVSLQLKDDEIRVVDASRLNHIKQLDLSTLQIMPASGNAVALSADGRQAFLFGLSNGQSMFESADITSTLSWSKLTSITPMSDSVARVSGMDAGGRSAAALFQLNSWTPFPNEAVAPAVAFAGCAGSPPLVLTVQPEDPILKVWTASDDSASLAQPISLSSEMPQSTPPANILQSPKITVLSCEDNNFHALLTTSSGTTSHLQLTLTKESHSSYPFWKWTVEEGLGHVSSALLLDASHAVVLDDLVAEDSEQEPDEIAKRLKLSARLSSQWQSFLGNSGNLFSSSSKDRLFGFLQVAVLVSERTHRLYGMELAGSNRGSVAWSVDLTPHASWHKLVHGTSNSPKAVHGIQGGTHAREVLVLSGNSGSVQWKCIDGTHGEVHAEGTLEILSEVLQVIPLVGGGICRQQALLMHKDFSTSLIPSNDQAAQSSLKHAIEASSNGFFAHVMVGEESRARLESYQIASATSPARLVGQTAFPGERLVQAVYPTRDEVVQSPCSVLGDDSLLLKYLNPHLAVLITVRDNSFDEEQDPFDAALKKAKQEADLKQKKKPVGVTPKGASKQGDSTTADGTTKEDEPNLFVNVVDTVSGRVLYRASHANAATSARNIKAVISENWIVYSFVNAKTRKTEVGVLTLYEGMIHRKGLTAFTSPEQTTEFSSWDARESKPVVLAKTYSMPKPITAMGVTQTRNGISSHQILMATNDDRIFAVERRMLEPRRPLSDLKDSEKLEGLRQYSELIPLVSLQALSYNLTVHAPTRILSSPTELESQTLVLAYGGPDLFFTRTSPSRGFDMLPESFNRALLSLLVVALVSVVFVTKKMSTKKILKHGWI